MHAITWVRKGLILILLVIASAIAFGFYYVYQINHHILNIPTTGYNFKIIPGASLKSFTHQLHNDKVIRNPEILRWYAFVLGIDASIKAGEYNIPSGVTVRQLLQEVVQGNVIQHEFTIIEGWRTRNVIAALNANPKIKHTLDGLTEQEILERLEIPETHLEGVFLPDTYYFTADTSDVAFLKRAYNAMQNKLKVAWERRSPQSILQTPYDALILASIIEKESGVYAEYEEIAGVFQRRMQKGMRLQADPCVIYGLGANYSGALLKDHLRSDSPYNTYTRKGLPPTPIAIPSMRAIEAALHPADGESMYFVATHKGHHVFSKDLQSHNLAVKQSRE